MGLVQNPEARKKIIQKQKRKDKRDAMRGRIREIHIKTIPHGEQRYDTAGDYWTDEDGIEQIRVSYMKDWRHGLLIAIHELTEKALTENKGIKERDISDFDTMFETERKQGLHSDDQEPGDDSRAPYKREHYIATLVEKIVALELGVDWQEYGRMVMSL